MKTEYEVKDSTKVIVKINYDENEFQEALKHSYEILAEDVSIKGFRKGKAPLEKRIPYVDQNKAFNKAVDKLLKRDLTKVVTDYTGEPSIFHGVQGILDVKSSDKGSVDLEITYVLNAAAKLGAYKGLKIELENKAITDEDVASKLKALATENGEMVVSDLPAALEDTVVIDFIGFLDGKAFDGGEAKDFSLKLGSNQFVPGFEDQLVGISEGETKTIQVTFPDNYVENLASKVADFKVTCHEVKKLEIPALDDEFSKTLTKYAVDSLDALKTKVKEELVKDAETKALNVKADVVLNTVIKNSTFTIDEALVNMGFEEEIKKVEEQYSQYGISYEEYLNLIKTDKETFEKSKRDESTLNIKVGAVMNAIIVAEKITITEEEIKKLYGDSVIDQINELKKKNPSQANQIVNSITTNVAYDNVKQFLLNNN